MGKIKPMTMPGTHKSFLKYLKKNSINKEKKILDLGAGHGAFTKTLYEMGYENLNACDLFPENFYFNKIKCKKVNFTENFPYPDNSFDIIIGIEVSEHILDHEVFFKELSRILKKDGELYLSTPNILSLKSRFKFLFKGFFYSFEKLEVLNYNGLQHVASITLDQYNYIAIKYGFKEAEFEIDRKQSTSLWLLFTVYPLIFTINKLKKVTSIHNNKDLLLGRLLFLKFKKSS